MLNTFQNYKLHKIRQDERELHLRTIEALSKMPDDDEEPSAVASMTEGILRGPSDMRERSALLCLRALPKKIIIFVVIALVSPIIALYVGLNARHPPIRSMTMGSRTRLMSMIQGWNATSLEQLEDYQSPPARALEWILSMDIDWNDLNALKEKFALATLFFATQSRPGNDVISWTNHNHWLSTKSTCSWYGISCMHDGANDTQRIRTLDLSLNGLQSSIPAEISLLGLESLGFHSNALTGTIPIELYRMVDLAYLYLDNNNLSGAIDSAIGNLTSLLDLRVSGNMLTGVLPAEIGHLSLLQIAYIDGNAISGMLPSEGLAKMMLLHEFQLHDNIISGNLPEELERLKMLRILYCDGNLLFGAMPEGMGQLTRLEALFLFGNQISGPIPQSFAQLSSLKEVQVHENQLSGPLGEDVISAWTNLQILRLHDNSFDGAIPSALSTLKELRIVQLHGNNFVGTVPDALCNSTELGILTSDCNDRVECFCCTRCFSH